MQTFNHDEIKAWAESRNATPAVVTAQGEPTGILRFDFGYDNKDLQHVEWEYFFKVFDDRELALLHATDDSNFNKLVSRHE